MNHHYSATLPHLKHPSITCRDLQLSKSKTLSSKMKQKKHFQIHLQKCQSLRFQTAESCFQATNNGNEQGLQKNEYISNANGENECYYQRKKYKNEREEGELRYEEDMKNCVHLQYQQPISSSKRSTSKQNGVAYVDGDINFSTEEDEKLKANSEFMPEIVLDIR